MIAVSVFSSPAASDGDEGGGFSLELAESAGQWLVDVGVRDDEGMHWPADALAPGAPTDDLSGGTAGVVAFLAGLANATGDDRFRDGALAGADYLASVVGNAADFAGNSRRASLYAGISGIGVALMAADELSGGGYRPAVDTVVDALEASAIRDGDAARWSDVFNDLLYGDAGTTLFLAFVADRHADDRALRLAVAGGIGLLRQAEHDSQGQWWRFRRDRPFNLPNFSHGTAGVVYVLATLSMMTGDDAFADGADGGFRYLQEIAKFDGQRLSIPYGWPEPSWEGVNAFGWGHGIAGTSLAFVRLGQSGIGGEAADDLLRLSLASLRDSGLPGAPTPPYSEASTPLDFRFGRAGALSVLARFSGRDDVTQTMMDALVSYLAANATREDGKASWIVDVPPFMGEGRAAFTGLFHGAAGVGLALLQHHSAAVGDSTYVLLPDDPRWVPANHVN